MCKCRCHRKSTPQRVKLASFLRLVLILALAQSGLSKPTIRKPEAQNKPRNSTKTKVMEVSICYPHAVSWSVSSRLSQSGVAAIKARLPVHPAESVQSSGHRHSRGCRSLWDCGQHNKSQSSQGMHHDSRFLGAEERGRHGDCLPPPCCCAGQEQVPACETSIHVPGHWSLPESVASAA